MLIIGEGTVAEDEAPTPVFLDQETTRNMNDNYRSRPASLVKVLQRLDKSLLQRTSQTVRSNVLHSSVLNVAKSQIHKTKTSANVKPLDVSCLAVSRAHSVCFPGHPQKKGISPFVSKIKIKDVKSVSCVSQCLSVPHAQCAPNGALNLIVGGRLQKLWQTWQSLGANQRVVSL